MLPWVHSGDGWRAAMTSVSDPAAGAAGWVWVNTSAIDIVARAKIVLFLEAEIQHPARCSRLKRAGDSVHFLIWLKLLHLSSRYLWHRRTLTSAFRQYLWHRRIVTMFCNRRNIVLDSLGYLFIMHSRTIRYSANIPRFKA